jgi:hypothetical protein
MSKFGSLFHYVMAKLGHSDSIYSSNVLLMMGAESTQNMYSNLTVNNKYDCLKLPHVGYLIKYIDGARNHQYIKKKFIFLLQKFNSSNM